MSISATEVTLKHWGNSLAMRIPAAVAHTLNLHENSRLNLRIEGGNVVLEPASPAVDVDELISKITARNRHSEAGFGGPEGSEAW